MKIEFKHKISQGAGRNLICVTTSQRVEVEFFFEPDYEDQIQEYPDLVHINGNEFDVADDMLCGIYVIVNNEVYSIKALADLASIYWERVRDEVVHGL